MTVRPPRYNRHVGPHDDEESEELAKAALQGTQGGPSNDDEAE
jgi:hypothetical protein